MKNSIILAAMSVLVISGCATPTDKQSSSSTAPAATQIMTDKGAHSAYANYEAQQGRIKSLNDTGKHRVASYSLAKAQCWLDVSLHEFTRNDRSNFPRLAYEESLKITDFLAKGGSAMDSANPANTTPLLNGASKLRPDLWDAAAKLNGSTGWRCAEQKTACAEVELAHAGNEFNQQQWRHAKPYLQIAEDLLGDAQRAAEACTPPSVAIVAPRPVAAVPVPVVPVPAMPVPVVPVNTAANVLFNFDKSDFGNVRPYTKDQLDSLITQVKSGAITVSSIKLIGHADRLTNTSDADYNVKLSRDRVETIRAYMVNQGVSAGLISTSYKAATQQVDACTESKFRSSAELQECLLPNRRVEVTVTGTRK